MSLGPDLPRRIFHSELTDWDLGHPAETLAGIPVDSHSGERLVQIKGTLLCL